MDESRKPNRKWKTLGGLGVLLATFGGKLKFLIPLLKLGKLGGTIWSMALMVGAYALIYPWTFAIGLVMMLLIHEMGHVWAARRKGLPVSAPAFIPFLGALITLKQQPKDAETEAFIAYGGPLLGSLGALLALGLAKVTDYGPLYAIAQVGFFLNLINLLPIHPLDGGRIVTAISRWLWGVGLIGGLVVILYLKAILFLFFWALFAWELYVRFVRKPSVQVPEEITEIRLDRQRFDDAMVMIPAEQHRRELEFMQFCRWQDKMEVCAVWYPGLGKIDEFAFTRGRIDNVELIQTRQYRDQISMRLKISCTPYDGANSRRTDWVQDEKYYQVSPRTRILYGVAYFGLAVALGGLMYYTAVVVPHPALTG